MLAHYVPPVSMLLLVLLLAHAPHEPGHFPSPPYPPHFHVEVASEVSSVTTQIPGIGVVQEVSADVSVPLTRQSIGTETGYMHVLKIS